MSQKILASQIMTSNVVVANLNNKFSQVMEFFTTYKVQHLPVAFDDKLLGILSVNDMASYLGNGNVSFSGSKSVFVRLNCTIV